MFSGIVEAKARVLSCAAGNGVLRIHVERPAFFDDLAIGDSVATNGVCLTAEAFDSEKIVFALGEETLQVTGWSESSLSGAVVNLERSLRVGDRVHGHFVTGHVDSMGLVTGVKSAGESTLLRIQVSPKVAPYVWRKGSLAVNGVSLTINDVVDAAGSLAGGREGGGPIVEHCLIPETLKRANLGTLKVGDSAAIEVDSAARAFLRSIELGQSGASRKPLER